jgi:hypothetical protein
MRILILLLFPLFSYSQLSIGILESSRSRFDADAQAFITSAAITNATQQNAINTLVIGLKADGLWTKMKAIYPFVGGSASSHKFNLKDPRDLNAAFRLTFNGGWTHSSTGALPNGTNGYAETFLTPSTALSLNNSHLSFYSRSNVAGYAGCAIGSINGSFTSANQIFIRFTDNLFYTNIDNTSFITYSNTNTTGYYITSRTASNLIKTFKNNSLMGSSIVPSVLLNNASIFISARSDGGAPVVFDNKECAFASIGDGLTDTEAANFYTRVQAFQTALSRQL